jgi:hypothetical protein
MLETTSFIKLLIFRQSSAIKIESDKFLKEGFSSLRLYLLTNLSRTVAQCGYLVRLFQPFKPS